MQQHKFVKNSNDFFKIISDQQYEINKLDFTHEDLVQIYYKYNTEIYSSNNNNQNVVVASFVTAQARIKLFNELLKINRNVLYYDTDSIIFVKKKDNYCPKLGNFLGDFTNEITPELGNHIDEFISAGSKNYCWRSDTGKTRCIIKGITLHNLAKMKLNFDTIKNIVCNSKDQKICVPQFKISRNKYDWQLRSDIINKNYGFVYNKRILYDDLTTLPYGF